MSIASLGFLLLALCLSFFFFWIPGPRARRNTLALLNLGFLATQVPNSWSWVVLFLFLASGYAVALLLSRHPRRIWFWTYLACLLGAFTLVKKYTFLDILLPSRLLTHPIYVIGLSYMLFRQIHFLVDAMQGQIRAFSFWTYLHYQINLFTLTAGPITRYPAFEADWTASRPVIESRQGLLHAYTRIMVGILAMTVAAKLSLWVYEMAVNNHTWGRHVRIPLALYGYPAFVYFNFAGYSSIVIGAASLLGMRIPENFNRPYRARNMIDYWNRWHMTLSHWLRDYLFTPCYAILARWRPRQASAFAPAVFFFVFVIAGIWHGSTSNFLVFGLLNGLGVSTAKAWENFIIRRKGRKGLRAYMQSRRVKVCAVAINFHFACATFLFFPTGIERCLQVLGSLTTGRPIS